MIDINPNDCRSGSYYDTALIDEFFKGFQSTKEDIKGKSLYFMQSGVSQDKVRAAGFSVCRSPEKADVIVVLDFYKAIVDYSSKRTYFTTNSTETSEFFDFVFNNQLNNYKYITVTDLYKYLYKYDGNQELFSQIDELLKSQDRANIQMAMEFMSNANWEANKIYLIELFNNHYLARIRSHSFKTSISFKGFLNSLDFNYKWLSLNSAVDYKPYCLNLEHHEWVRYKYKKEFEDDLKSLFETHKMKIDKLEYSIDM